MNPVYGGPPESVRSMVNVATRCGHDVQVYATSLGYLDTDTLMHDGGSTDSKDVYQLFRPSFPASWFNSKDLFEELKINVDKFDLLHLHVPFTAPFSFAADLAIKKNIPFIATLHGLLDRWSMTQKAWKKIPYYYLVEKAHLSAARFLHVTSTLEERDVLRLNLGVPIENIPLAVESENFTNFYYNDFQKIRLLFVGRLHPVKSIPTILEAISLLVNSGMDVMFDLAGSGSPSYEAHLRSLINNYAISNRVVWHGHVGLKEKQALFQASTLFVMPSLHENFGLAAAEAMSAGIPVVISDQVGLAPNVEKWGAGSIIPVGDAFALADAVRAIIQGGCLSQMGSSAKALIQNQYSTESFTKGLIEMYLRAINYPTKNEM